MGVASELEIRNMLVVQVSPHARRAVKELDAARRIMYRAREDHALPIGYSDLLISLHGRKPFPNSPQEIAELAAQIRDPGFRIQKVEDKLAEMGLLAEGESLYDAAHIALMHHVYATACTSPRTRSRFSPVST